MNLLFPPLGHFGLILHRARRYEESIAQFEKALELNPNYANAMWFKALSLEQMGRLGESIDVLECAVKVSAGLHYRALLGRAHAMDGNRQKALEILDKLKEFSGQRYVSPFDLAVVHAGLGEWDAVFHYLEEAYQQRAFRIIELTMPMFDNLRRDSRWQDLVRRIGLV